MYEVEGCSTFTGASECVCGVWEGHRSVCVWEGGASSFRSGECWCSRGRCTRSHLLARSALSVFVAHVLMPARDLAWLRAPSMGHPPPNGRDLQWWRYGASIHHEDPVGKHIMVLALPRSIGAWRGAPYIRKGKPCSSWLLTSFAVARLLHHYMRSTRKCGLGARMA